MLLRSCVASRGAARCAQAQVAVATRSISNVGEMDVEEVIRSRKTNMSKTYDGFQTFKDPVVIERAKGQYCYGMVFCSQHFCALLLFLRVHCGICCLCILCV